MLSDIDKRIEDWLKDSGDTRVIGEILRHDR